MQTVKVMNGWSLAGYCAVDSGQLMITDPCYIGNNWIDDEYSDEPSKSNTYSYSNVCSTTLRHSAGEVGNGLAVVTETTYGDGRFPVYVRFEHGRPVEVRVILDDSEFGEELAETQQDY